MFGIGAREPFRSKGTERDEQGLIVSMSCKCFAGEQHWCEVGVFDRQGPSQMNMF